MSCLKGKFVVSYHHSMNIYCGVRLKLNTRRNITLNKE
jgi:hypothetical protein